MTKPRLFQLEISPSCGRVFIVLDHKGIDHEMVSVDISKPDRPAEFTMLSPFGKVPVWQEDETVIFESAVINEYLEESYPDPPMLPGGPARRAYARQWIKYFDSQIFERNIQFIPTVRIYDSLGDFQDGSNVIL